MVSDKKVLALGVLLSLTVASLGDAVGQNVDDAPGDSLQEITVTATRSAELQSRVPISVTAFTQAQMDKQGIKNIDDVVRLTPGINLNRGNNNTNNIAIRGISSPAGASTTGIYIDDVPIQARNLGYASGSGFPVIFDLERVEVLRGPQGTLFGAGSEGGTVRFIQPAPSLAQYSGYARAEVSPVQHGDTGYEGGAAFGGPIIEDKIGFRVSAYHRRDAGWVDAVRGDFTVTDPSGNSLGDSVVFTPSSVADRNTNWRESSSFRLALTAQPFEQLRITPSFFYQRLHAHDVIDNYWVSLSDPSRGQFRIPRFTAVPADAAHIAFSAPSNQPSTYRFGLPSLKLEYDNAAFAIISDTSYFDRKVDQTIDHTTLYTEINARQVPQPGDIAVTDLKDQQKNFTQELRIQTLDTERRLTWLAGAFYSHNEQISRQWERQNFFALVDNPYGFGVVADGPPFGPGYSAFMNTFGVPPLPDGTSYYGDFRTQEEQLAVFGQTDFKLTQRVKLTTGLRAAKSKISYRAAYDGPEQNVNAPFGRECLPSEAPCVPGQGAFVPFYGGGSASNKENYWTPRLGLSFQADENNLYYGTISKGFRPAGAQARLTTACNPDLIANGFVDASGNADAPTTYKSDFVWNYEVGAKNHLLEGRLRLDGSLYYIKWSDLQGNINIPGCASVVTTNLGEATSRGFDVGAQVRPIDALTLGAAVGYNKTTYDKTRANLQTGRIIFSKNSRVGGSGPPWLVTLNGQYDFHIASHGLYLRSDYSYTSKLYADTRAGTYDPLSPPAEETSLLNVRLGWLLGSMDVSAFVDNVTNAHPDLAFARTAVGRVLYTNRTFQPRTYGVTAAFRF
jgi:outer membrane receptor protein involved in Fe transport